jgi:cell division protein FtsW (lipid II flippase)
MLVLRRRRSIAYHRALLAVLTPQQREHRERFIRKATGWFGGAFIAIKETWELAEHNEWHPAVFVLLLVVMLALVGGNTVEQASRWSRGTG